MKYSIYNSLLELSDNSFLLYNAYTDAFVVFNKKYKDLVLYDIESLKSVNISLYKKIMSAQSYISEEIDEHDCLKRFADSIIMQDDTFFLIVNPTMACNFKCWYCYENHVKGSKMTKSIMDCIQKLSQKILEENPRLRAYTLGFFGGEPLLYFNDIALPLIKAHSIFCKKNNLISTISFTSNGSLITENLIDEIKEYGDINFQITLDGNKELHDKVRYFNKNKGSYKTIVNNIMLLLNNNISVRLRFNYTKDNCHSFIDVLNDLNCIPLENRGIFEIDFHQIWQEKDGVNIIDGIHEVVDAYVNSNFKVIFADLDEIRNACYADKKNSLVVNYNGDVFKCTAQEFSKDKRVGFLNRNGTVTYERSQEHHQNLKLSNPRCHKCRIAPLCGGGCSRYIIEKEDTDYCVFKNNEELIDQQILYRFDSFIRNKGR